MKEHMMSAGFMNFLNARDRVIRVRATQAPVAGYIWRRVFLRGVRVRAV